MAASSVGSGKGHSRIASTQKRGSVVGLSGCVFCLHAMLTTITLRQ